VNRSGGARDALRLLRTMTWALRTTTTVAPALAAGLTVVTVLRALVPAGLALTARGLINVAVRSLGAGEHSFTPLVPWLALGLGIALVEALAPLCAKLFTQRLNDELNLRMTSEFLAHAARLDLASLEDPRLRETVDRAQQASTGNLMRLVTDLQATASDLVQIVVLIGVLMALEPLVLLVVGPFALPYLFFQWRIAAKRYSEESSRTAKRRWTRYFLSLVTGTQSAPEVKLLGLAPLLIGRFRSLLAEFRDADRRLYLHDFAGSSSFAVLTTAAFYLMFARVMQRVVQGALTIGDIALFATVSSRLRATLERLVLASSSAFEQALYIEDLRSFLELTPQLADGTEALPSRVAGGIELEDVTFTYPGASTPTLDGVSLSIAPGEVVALVGENGAGKTTLVRLIARLYDPDQGCVRLDGVDLRDLRLDELHGQIAFVTQGSARYEATAGENIAYGDWRRALGDRQRVVEAAIAGGVHDLIQSLPQRYDTRLGKTFGEHDLSGGEWQKLATARAFARYASLLILDEPTAHLDARAEYDLFLRFRALARGRTTILVSHRFSTLTMADRILVMEGGRIVESGTHRELIERRGSYATLYAYQSRQMALGAAGGR
jgi:ATP-binding cassette subfamily B protein